MFGDGANRRRRHAQAHPAFLALHPETFVLHVGQKTPLGLVVCVGDIVSHNGFFTRDLAYARHDSFLTDESRKERDSI